MGVTRSSVPLTRSVTRYAWIRVSASMSNSGSSRCGFTKSMRAALDDVGAALEVEPPALDLGAPRHDRGPRRALHPQVGARREGRQVVVDAQRAGGAHAQVQLRPRLERGRLARRRHAADPEQLRGDVVAPVVERLAHVDRAGDPLPLGCRRTGGAARRAGCACPRGSAAPGRARPAGCRRRSSRPSA